MPHNLDCVDAICAIDGSTQSTEFSLLLQLFVCELRHVVQSSRTFYLSLQIPDTRTGNDRVDAVVVDEEAVRSAESNGCGAKILCGHGALDQYLMQHNLKDPVVCNSNSDLTSYNVSATSPITATWMSFLNSVCMLEEEFRTLVVF